MSETRHVPIMVQPILDAILPVFEADLRTQEGNQPAWFVDGTLGGGGHTARFLAALRGLGNFRVLAIDQDAEAIARASQRFRPEIESGHLEIHQCKMSAIKPLLEGRRILGMMADLGFSSDQIDNPERGLSFRFEGPLDMRLDPSQGVGARQYLQTVTERELEKTLQELGEERFARRIAQAIIQARRARALPETTSELAELVLRAVPPPARHGRIHAATRTFQALRIQVNHELEELDTFLEIAAHALAPGGRLAVLSFHSLEDRRVKLAFRGEAFTALTKKPLEADEREVTENPRARSAKLRVGERR